MGANSRLGAYSNKYGIAILLGHSAGTCAEESWEYDDGVVMGPVHNDKVHVNFRL